MRENNRKRDNNKSFSGPYARNALPALKLLENYQSTSPELVDKMVEMAKKEQDHRHSWQDKYLKSYNNSYKIGQLTGIVYNLLLLGLIYYLVVNGNKAMALELFIVNALLIFLAITVTFIERRISTRKPTRRNPKQDKRNNRNPSQEHRSYNTRSGDVEKPDRLKAR